MSPASTHREVPAPIFAALGDATRLELISRLSDGRQHSITELTEGFSVTRQAVTKHLKVLSEAGLISRQQVGRESRFEMRRETIDSAKEYLARISDQWDQAIVRLRALVED